jgi:predicted Zn-dependent peptidase
MRRHLIHGGLALCLVLYALVGLGQEAVPVPSHLLPPYEVTTLGNGTRVLLMEKHDTPLIALAAEIRGGSVGDPIGREGTADLLAQLLRKGAGSRNATQFSSAVDQVGASLSVSASNESLTVGAGFMSRDTDLLLSLVADVLIRPTLAPAEFEKVRTNSIQSLAAAKDSDPRSLLASYGDAFLFGSHPYGRPPSGEERSVAKATLTDLKRFYAEQMGGDRLIIAVVGDFKTGDMRRRIEAAFGGWRKAGAAPPTVTAPSRSLGRRVLLVDKPEATQTYFWLGNVGASRTDPARTAQQVANTVFGGRYTSMLNSELRIKSGLTYGAASSFDRLVKPGSFSLSSYTRTEKTTDAIDLALATLDRLHADGVDETTLASASSYLRGQYPPKLETNAALAAAIAGLEMYGLGREEIDQYALRVAGVDAAAVRDSIADVFPKSTDLAMVLIGDASKIRSAVAKYGPVTEMKISDPAFRPIEQP